MSKVNFDITKNANTTLTPRRTHMARRCSGAWSLKRVVHIQHRVHVGDSDKRKHFATLRMVFLAEGADKGESGKGVWLSLEGFETGVATVLARETGSKSIGGRGGVCVVGMAWIAWEGVSEVWCFDVLNECVRGCGA